MERGAEWMYIKDTPLYKKMYKIIKIKYQCAIVGLKSGGVESY